MTLPTIETPRHTLKLPSTGKNISFRPFIERERKLILQGMEMGDADQLNNAVEDVLNGCTFDKLVLDDLAVYDIEWILLKVRAKSVSEQVELTYTCNNKVPVGDELTPSKKCGTRIPAHVNLNDVQLTRPENHHMNIMISDTVGLVMRDLTYGVYKSLVGKKIVEISLDLIASCVDSVFDADQVYERTDFTNEELTEFLGKLISDDFSKLEEFISTIPKLSLTIDIKCPKCGATDQVVVSGIDDFLA